MARWTAKKTGAQQCALRPQGVCDYHQTGPYLDLPLECPKCGCRVVDA